VPAKALDELILLGLQGKIDFFIPLENVCVIWYAVFGERKDHCGYYQPKEREYFKITTESLETLATSKGREGSHYMQLEMPIEMRVNYAESIPGDNPDNYHYISELRGLSHQSDPTSTKLSVKEAYNNLTPKTGAKGGKPSGNLDVVNLRKKRKKGGNLGGNLDDVEWEKFDDDKLEGLLNYDIYKLFLLRTQVEPLSDVLELVVDSNAVRSGSGRQVDPEVCSLHEGLDDIMKKFCLLLDESEPRSRNLLRAYP